VAWRRHHIPRLQQTCAWRGAGRYVAGRILAGIHQTASRRAAAVRRLLAAPLWQCGTPTRVAKHRVASHQQRRARYRLSDGERRQHSTPWQRLPIYLSARRLCARGRHIFIKHKSLLIRQRLTLLARAGRRSTAGRGILVISRCIANLHAQAPRAWLRAHSTLLARCCVLAACAHYNLTQHPRKPASCQRSIALMRQTRASFRKVTRNSGHERQIGRRQRAAIRAITCSDSNVPLP